jgi:hypothetical protein
MIKYRISNWGTIDPFEIESETDKTITFIDGFGRRCRDTKTEMAKTKWFDTFGEALQSLINAHMEQIKEYRLAIDNHIKMVEKLKEKYDVPGVGGTE